MNILQDGINYWIPFDFDVNHRYPSIKFPRSTTVAYTSEVADETAQGDYLNLCARAHLDHDLATLDMLLEGQVVMRESCICKGDKIKMEETRIRPIIVSP